jgi:DNA modification methylase
LITELIKKHSNTGDLVLDCFAGTGTTGHACSLIDRKFILIEKEQKYFDIIKERLNKINIL